LEKKKEQTEAPLLVRPKNIPVTPRWLNGPELVFLYTKALQAYMPLCHLNCGFCLASDVLPNKMQVGDDQRRRAMEDLPCITKSR
jgi:hypothetical protein